MEEEKIRSMYEKYVVYYDQIVLAFKYDVQGKDLIVGGNKRFRQTMEDIIVTYFKCNVPTPRFMTANKMRYMFGISRKKFDEGVKKLKEDHVILNPVKALGDIMR